MVSPQKNLRMGIFGGTFNPVHNGHISAAKAAFERLKLDRMFIIPSAIPPHKKLEGNADSMQRLEMTRLAFEGIQGFEVLDIEIKRQGLSYTIDTIITLQELYPDAEFYLIMGTDMFLTIEKWHKGEQIIDRVVLVAIPRHSGEMDELNVHADMLKRKYNARVVILDIPPVDISSTEIRTKADACNTTDLQIPPKIALYIQERGLYR